MSMRVASGLTQGRRECDDRNSLHERGGTSTFGATRWRRPRAGHGNTGPGGAVTVTAGKTTADSAAGGALTLKAGIGQIGPRG